MIFFVIFFFEIGESIEIYNGKPDHLSVNSLRRVLPDAGSFYIFSVVGVDLDKNPDDVARREFCWLTGYFL